MKLSLPRVEKGGCTRGAALQTGWSSRQARHDGTDYTPCKPRLHNTILRPKHIHFSQVRSQQEILQIILAMIFVLLSAE